MDTIETLMEKHLRRLEHVLHDTEMSFMYATNMKRRLSEMVYHLKAEISVIQDSEEYKSYLKKRIPENETSNDNQ